MELTKTHIHCKSTLAVFFGKPVRNLFFFFFFQIRACFFEKSIVITTPGSLSFTCAVSRSSPTVYVSSSASHSIPVFPPRASVSRVIQPFGERLCCFYSRRWLGCATRSASAAGIWKILIKKKKPDTILFFKRPPPPCASPRSLKQSRSSARSLTRADRRGAQH